MVWGWIPPPEADAGITVSAFSYFVVAVSHEGLRAVAKQSHSMMEIYPARLRDFSSEEGYSQWHAQCCAIVTLTTGVPEPPTLRQRRTSGLALLAMTDAVIWKSRHPES